MNQWRRFDYLGLVTIIAANALVIWHADIRLFYSGTSHPGVINPSRLPQN